MKLDMRFFGTLLAVLLFGSVTVHAQSATQALVVSSCNAQSYTAGTTRPVTIDTAGNLCGLNGTASTFGADSGAVIGAGTVNGSSHAAGTSVGGLITVALARTNGGSGIITNFAWTSPGGATNTYVVRIWQKNPASTTCTDNSAFSGNATDDQNLITPPFSITAAAPANTTGDSKTYASLTGLSWDYKNGDTSASKNLYVCLITTATNTADESTSPYVMLSGPQN